MKNILESWNIFDQFISMMESKIDELKDLLINAPDPELMIEAETIHLKEENRSLKALQFPKQVITKENKCFCPNQRCEKEIHIIMVTRRIKHCPDCGQRIYFPPN